MANIISNLQIAHELLLSTWLIVITDFIFNFDILFFSISLGKLFFEVLFFSIFYRIYTH